MNLQEAKDKIITDSIRVKSPSWDSCKIIRKAILSDEDYINYPHQGIIVEDCTNRKCDCKIAIYIPTPDDEQLNDFEVVA